jgi:hypothetical protein
MESSTPVGTSFSIADKAVRFASASVKVLVTLSGSVALRIQRTSWGSIRTRIERRLVPARAIDASARGSHKSIEKAMGWATPEAEKWEWSDGVSMVFNGLQGYSLVAKDLGVVAIPDLNLRDLKDHFILAPIMWPPKNLSANGCEAKMRIAQLAPCMKSSRRNIMAETERIVSYRTEELVRQKHEGSGEGL